MVLEKMLKSWKYPSILLIGIGVSSIGSWIYFIALNLMVLNMTHSPLAIAVLYILRRVATLLTNLWSGSLIDRVNKRNLMVILDFVRAILIVTLAFNPSMWFIYTMVILINMADSMFEPTSMTYITKLIPEEQKSRFNSLHSLMSSGAFLIGPAIAGLLFLVGSPIMAIYINAIALAVSGIITWMLPNVEETTKADQNEHKISFDLLKADWKIVLQFYRRETYIMMICLLSASVLMVMAASVDSLEASFATLVLYLSEADYGVLVSIAGAGIIVGAIVNTVLVTKIPVSITMSLGTLGVCLGYVIYAFSDTFLVAAIGFFVLAFFLSFANTATATFYQINIPVSIMGRVGSINGFIEALLIIITTAAIGVVAEVVSIPFAVIAAVLLMLLLGIILSLFVLSASKRKYYELPLPSL